MRGGREEVSVFVKIRKESRHFLNSSCIFPIVNLVTISEDSCIIGNGTIFCISFSAKAESCRHRSPERPGTGRRKNMEPAKEVNQNGKD